MAKKNRYFTRAQGKAQIVPAGENLKGADWCSRGLAIGSLIVSVSAIVISVLVARWTSPYFFAAPDDLTYVFVQSNVLDAKGHPLESKLAVRVRNSAKTPARDIRVSIRPITSAPEILCDQKATVQKGPWGIEVVNIERVPAGGEAALTITERTDEFPLFYEPMTGLKYQYAAMIQNVQSEFGSVKCDYSSCAVFYRPLPDDVQELYVRTPSAEVIREMLEGTDFENSEIVAPADLQYEAPDSTFESP